MHLNDSNIHLVHQMPLVSVCKFFSGSWHTTAWKPRAATLEIRKKQMFKHTIMPTKTWISNLVRMTRIWDDLHHARSILKYSVLAYFAERNLDKDSQVTDQGMYPFIVDKWPRWQNMLINLTQIPCFSHASYM